MDNVLADRAQFNLDNLTAICTFLDRHGGGPRVREIHLHHSPPLDPVKLTVKARLEVNSEAQAVLCGARRLAPNSTPNPKHANDRRGAHWTFVGPAYAAFVARNRNRDVAVVYALSFDHALKDPTPDTITFAPSHLVVVIEGSYTMLDVGPQRSAAVLVDERWWIVVDPAWARALLVRRHVRTGVARDANEAV